MFYIAALKQRENLHLECMLAHISLNNVILTGWRTEEGT